MAERRCTYPFSYSMTSSNRCEEWAYGNSPYCILHVDFPDVNAPEFKEVRQKKREKVQEKTGQSKRDFNFEGAKIIDSIDLLGRRDINRLNFANATVNGRLLIDHTNVEGDACFYNAAIKFLSFNNATINGNLWFRRTTIEAGASFMGAAVEGNMSFEGATIKSQTRFDGATIEGDITFLKAERTNKDGSKTIKPASISGNTNFKRAAIKGDVLFDDAVICGEFKCHSAEIVGKLSFDHAKILQVGAQEEAYRKAKQAWEKLGDRKRADDYFYKEMVAKREQKAQPMKFLEQLIIQYALGYGVYPLRMMLTWIVIALAMGAFLTSLTGDINYLPFGIAAAFVPGYGLSGYGISPSHNIATIAFSGISLWIIRIEALVSEFFVAAFIVVFSRKFMR